MRKYFTGLVPMKGECRLGAKWRGRGWNVYLARGRAKIRKHFSGSPTEIVIEAANLGTAQRALNLIQTAHNLLSGGPGFLGDSLKIIPADPVEYQKVYRDPLFDKPLTVNTAGFPQACRLAVISSRRRAYAYALALYQISLSIHSNHPMDLEHYLPPEEHRSPVPHDHVRFAYAIVTAYAVLEQLGLALHGEAFENRKWIPAKRAELEHRLIKAGVNLAEPALWQLRGGRTRVDARRRTQALGKAVWALGFVRDEEVDVVDAIADLRWLRSAVAAHDVKDLASLLSIYDVANAQYMARRCILASLGFERK